MSGVASHSFSLPHLDRKRLYEEVFRDKKEESSVRKVRKITDLTPDAMEGIDGELRPERLSSVQTSAFRERIPKLPLKQLQNKEMSLEQAVLYRNFAHKAMPIYSNLEKQAKEREESSCNEKRKKNYAKRAEQYADCYAKADRVKRGADLKIKELTTYDHINRSSECSIDNPYFS